MIQPLRSLVEDSTAGTTTGGVLLSADATFAGSVPGLASGGGAGGGETTGGGAGGGEADAGGANGSSSVLTVAIVVMLAGLATAGAGASCRLSEGIGERESVCTVAGWTMTVFTVIGLIGSMDPGIGPSRTAGPADATRTGAEPVRSSSLPSLRA